MYFFIFLCRTIVSLCMFGCVLACIQLHGSQGTCVVGCEGHVEGKQGVGSARSAPCLDSPQPPTRLIGQRKNQPTEQDTTCCDEESGQQT